MKTFYVNFSVPSSQKIMNISTAKTLGWDNWPAQTVEDFENLIHVYKPAAVLFRVGLEFPQRPVPVDHPKLRQHLARMVRAWNKAVQP